MSELFLDKMRDGAFLTVKNNQKANTMTIGWAMEGIVWGKKVLTVLVRKQRYTHELMKDAEYFTVSIPHKGALKEAISYFGTHSGRDEDKYESGLLTMAAAKAFDGLVVSGAESVYECKVLYRQELLGDSFVPDAMDTRMYSAKDYHVFYIGEILEAY